MKDEQEEFVSFQTTIENNPTRGIVKEEVAE